PFFHAPVSIRLCEYGRCRDGDAASVTLNEGFLLDENVELNGVEKQIVGLKGKLLQRSGHGLARRLIDVPGIDALGVDFSDGPGDGVLADARGQLGTALRSELFRVVEPHDAPLGIQNDRSGYNGAEQSAATCLIEPSDAAPTEFACRALVTRRAKTRHRRRSLAHGKGPGIFRGLLREKPGLQ